MPSSIFVVDSSPAVRRLVEQTSAPEGFDVMGFNDGPAALAAAKQGNPALIIVDYYLENMTFSGFCKEINKLDNLTETYLISLVNQADNLDENLFRSLGVKGFLKKPFHPDELLTIIKYIQQKQQKPEQVTKPKRRAWPPSAADDDTDEEAGSAQVATVAPSLSPDPSLGVALSAALNATPSPATKPVEPAITRPSTSMPTAPVTRTAAANPEDSTKNIFDQLMQSMTHQAEQRLADVLPKVIEEKLASQVQPIVHKELWAQLGDVLSEERLATIIQPIVSRELPSLLGKEIASHEPIIRQTVSDLIGTVVKAKLDIWVQEQAESGLRQHLSGIIREQIGSIDQIVKDEVQATVHKLAPPILDETVRTASERAIEQAVQHIVPELAVQHITAELKRLTASS
ncbi:MAG: response regulator [Nitrospira sp.]|nr:response regulator [Nitrospira sp.]